jgi:hypothetical protein
MRPIGDAARHGDRAGAFAGSGLADLRRQFGRVAPTDGLQLPPAHFGAHCFLKKLGCRESALLYHFVEICR